MMLINKTGRYLLLLVFCAPLVIVDFCIVQAQEPITAIIYRDAEGLMHENPIGSENSLLQLATDNGYVTLWITLNYPFNFYFESMSSREIEYQQRQVEAQFSEMLAPLIANGEVWLPEIGPYVRGPGCSVRANSEGIGKLIQDKRLLQIVLLNEQHD